ncbi:hypothetical protein TBLA_0A07350 [Henningerozyma blattae CBS 6284]|uniref:Peptide-methionine (R)-S-oxide reductase n=1 Tax=Henningerozyma blattae (strain ATCC 34711 / CBS 6284 / DSM 70876 / NBRC 10599 / NRRL Y-10934 / UCD 77-7) TaxID=1071380 RepID=I2GWM2_HENB6|nr:hypothetical protein TBLA_0A07350 [Tetrapisispora blattae CBS 6284]CCH58524.1 hypothetical protein TBLA_0A07350 [Tetrapisispora blattae CBS 6284]
MDMSKNNSSATINNMVKWNPNLKPEQLKVLKDGATEPPNSGKYLNNTKPGTYYCANCEAPLYSSNAKFNAGCGWPSFYEEIQSGSVMLVQDESLGMERTEALCGGCGGHLGHVFAEEGWTKRLGIPKDVRHCINSLSLNFHESTPSSKE